MDMKKIQKPATFLNIYNCEKGIGFESKKLHKYNGNQMCCMETGWKIQLKEIEMNSKATAIPILTASGL